jgi:hypothetical protein
LAITKGAAIIHGLATAFKALTAAIASNPIGAIAVVITAVLIPALIALYKNWDTVQTYLQQGLARLQFAFKWLGSVIEEGLVVAFNSVKAAAVTFVDFIYGNIIRAVGNMLEIMGKLPFVGDLFLAASEKVNILGNAIGNLAEDTRQASAEAIQAAHDKQDATQAELESTLAAIDTEAQARRAAIEEQKQQNEELKQQNEERIQYEAETQEQITAIKSEALENQIKTLAERLSEVPLTEQQIQTQQIEQFQQFLQQRMELQFENQEQSRESEMTSIQERIDWLREQQALLLESKAVEGEERIALEKSINDMILAEDKKLNDAQEQLTKNKLNAVGQFFNGVSDLANASAKDSVAALVIEKAAAAAEAAINSYLAFTEALASSPPPLNYIAAAGVLASGIAQQVKILSTPIPSAETGGRFIVPYSAGSDNGFMRVNSGEEVEVTPRGMAGFNKLQQIIVQIEKQTIFDVMNEGIRSGDILIQAVNF